MTSCARGATGITDRPFVPVSPTTMTVDVWPWTSEAALLFWARASKHRALSAPFRSLAGACLRALEDKREQLRHLVD